MRPVVSRTGRDLGVRAQALSSISVERFSIPARRANAGDTTERIVEQNLSNLECTRIVIAHRPSTIRNADLILVLDGGEIMASGTHEELITQSDLYAALVAAAPDTYPVPDLVA